MGGRHDDEQVVKGNRMIVPGSSPEDPGFFFAFNLPSKSPCWLLFMSTITAHGVLFEDA